MVRGNTKNEVLIMHTVCLQLQTTKQDEYEINRRFFALFHIHNVTVKHTKKLLKKLEYSKKYQTALKEYKELLKKKTKLKKSSDDKQQELSKEDKARKKELSDYLSEFRYNIGLTETGLQHYIKVCAKQYRKLLSSQQIQREVTRVWHGVERVLFGDGENIRFKKFDRLHTIGGKSNKNGARFHKDSISVTWIGLDLKCRLPKSDADRDYIYESMSNDISYCEIERKMFQNGYHYYVIVYIKGNAPHKIQSIGCNTMGIDPGVSTVAGVSDDTLVLKELAPKCKEYNKKIAKLQRGMDTSKRNTNPDKFNDDGTIKKGNHEKWKFSKAYKKRKRKLQTLYRKKSAYTKQSHEELCNRILKDSVNFIVEDMSYKALQKRAKKTERNTKASDIKQKDGTVKRVHKYKRKKRLGKSVNDRSPASFLNILEHKSLQYSGFFVKTNTKTFKASQYNHVTDTYEKSRLSERSKQIGGITVQRDLYSAFLTKNADAELKHADREKCIAEFDGFVAKQNELIAEMKQNGISMKQCFGF